jgi:hypothetical protein
MTTQTPILTAEWVTFTPPLYRYMPRQHVEEFFADGSLRLSSFAKFHQHEDEQRLDNVEGQFSFLHVNSEGIGQTIGIGAAQGGDSYVLSTSTRLHRSLMKKFKSDSYFEIRDASAFGVAIGRHVEAFVRGIEGPCMYQDVKTLIFDLGPQDLERFKAMSKDDLFKFIESHVGFRALLLKDRSYSHQYEYRLLWTSNAPLQEHLHIKVPEGRQFCLPPSESKLNALSQPPYDGPPLTKSPGKPLHARRWPVARPSASPATPTRAPGRSAASRVLGATSSERFTKPGGSGGTKRRK